MVLSCNDAVLDEGWGSCEAIGLIGHHFEKGWARTGFVHQRRGRHWVEEACGERGIELCKGRRKII